MDCKKCHKPMDMNVQNEIVKYCSPPCYRKSINPNYDKNKLNPWALIPIAIIFLIISIIFGK